MITQSEIITLELRIRRLERERKEIISELEKSREELNIYLKNLKDYIDTLLREKK